MLFLSHALDSGVENQNNWSLMFVHSILHINNIGTFHSGRRMNEVTIRCVGIYCTPRLLICVSHVAILLCTRTKLFCDTNKNCTFFERRIKKHQWNMRNQLEVEMFVQSTRFGRCQKCVCILKLVCFYFEKIQFWPKRILDRIWISFIKAFYNKDPGKWTPLRN